MNYKKVFLRALRSKQPIHIQGSRTDKPCIVSCKHPLYNTTLYVTNNPRKHQPFTYSGNIHNAMKFSLSVAKMIRADIRVTEDSRGNIIETRNNALVLRCA